MPIIEEQTGERDMSKIIKTKRVVVAPNGDEFDNETAFKRHAFQAAAGKARTRIAIKREDTPLRRSPDPDDAA